MTNGKPAGMPCIHLDNNYACLLFGQAVRPRVCLRLKPCQEMCGNNREEALTYLQSLENMTRA